MNKSVVAIAIFALLLLRASTVIAAESSELRVLKAQIVGNALHLQFSAPMLTWTGPSAPGGLVIDPPIPCTWSWSDDTELTCQAGYDGAEPRPATRYKITIRGGLWSQQGNALDPQTLSVDSRRPIVDDASVPEWRDGHPTVEITTNVPVTATSLRSSLQVLTDDEPIGFELNAIPNPLLYGSAYAKDTKWRIELAPIGAEHQVDDRYARFYCEQLPPGAHDVYYYARATHDGHFAAMPAVAELMYGSASIARSDSAVVDIAADSPE